MLKKNSANNCFRVLLDTNVFIAGLVSKTGASSAILDLGEAEEIEIIIPQYVLIEADGVFQKKFPKLTQEFRLFIKNLKPIILEEPSKKEIKDAQQYISDPYDAPILASAKTSRADFLVTLDIKHFKNIKTKNYLTIPIVTPAEFLAEFRKLYEDQ